ncbi:hypothetical protein NIES4074_23970 [Cylindrospermum sp. NIES-4074]|nr:hypothetical protein NIES4074_23970 [Cylindrospermum sp. NIES-4074]
MSLNDIQRMSAEVRQASKIAWAKREGLGKFLSKQGKYVNVVDDFTKKAEKARLEAEKAIKNGNQIKKTADKAAKGIDLLQKGLFKEVSPKLASALRVGSLGLSIGSAIIGVVNSKAITELSELDERQRLVAADEMNRQLRALKSVSQRVSKLEVFKAKADRQLDYIFKEYRGVQSTALKGREIANNALYEVRQGRKILEGKIKSSENAINLRINKINETYQKVRADITKLLNNTQAGISKEIVATIAKIQQANESISLQSKVITKLETAFKNIKPPDKIDLSKITTDVTDKLKQLFNPQLSKISSIESTANKAGLDATEAKNTSTALKADLGNLRIVIDRQVNALANQDSTLASGIVNLNQSIAAQNKNIEAIDKKSVVPDFSSLQKKLDAQFNQFVADNNKALNVRDLQQSKLGQEFDRKLAELANLQNLTNDQRFQQIVAQNQQALKTRDLQQSELSKKIETDINAAINNFSKTSDQRFNDFINQNKTDFKTRDAVDQGLSRQIQELQRSNATIEANLRQIETKAKEDEKLNKEGNEKLAQMLPIIAALPIAIAGIPALTAKLTPTIPQITQATGTAICNSANGGCLSNALNNTSNNINQNTNNQNSNLLDKLNALGQGADLALLGVINDKLGDKVPGGLSGFLTKGFQWLHLDRVLNVLIFISTLHNAAMLSNNLGQTLLQAIANGLTLIGIKDESGGDIDLNAVIGNTAQGVIQGIIGTDNYTSLSLAWIKASRIYQANANVISSITNMSDVILNGVELVAGGVAKVANALRNWRVVGEKAYEVMNPQPNLKWGIFNKLQKAQESADFILQVSQVPVDLTQAATEFTNSATELTKAIKEDPEVPPGLKIQDAAQTKEKEGVVKAASIAALVSEIDLEPDEEAAS